jgi:hypothetical protein
MDRGIHWPVTMFGIISAVLLAGALAPQYWEIYRLKEVKGKEASSLNMAFIDFGSMKQVYLLHSCWLIWREGSSVRSVWPSEVVLI